MAFKCNALNQVTIILIALALLGEIKNMMIINKSNKRNHVYIIYIIILICTRLVVCKDDAIVNLEYVEYKIREFASMHDLDILKDFVYHNINYTTDENEFKEVILPFYKESFDKINIKIENINNINNLRNVVEKYKYVFPLYENGEIKWKFNYLEDKDYTEILREYNITNLPILFNLLYHPSRDVSVTSCIIILNELYELDKNSFEHILNKISIEDFSRLLKIAFINEIEHKILDLLLKNDIKNIDLLITMLKRIKVDKIDEMKYVNKNKKEILEIITKAYENDKINENDFLLIKIKLLKNTIKEWNE